MNQISWVGQITFSSEAGRYLFHSDTLVRTDITWDSGSWNGLQPFSFPSRFL